MIVLKLFHYLCRQSVVWFTVIFGFPVNLSAAAKNWSGHWKLSLLSCYVFIFKPANHQKNVYSENFRLYHTIGLCKAQVIIVWHSETALELATCLKYPVPALSERSEHCWQWPRPIFMCFLFFCVSLLWNEKGNTSLTVTLKLTATDYWNKLSI